ncbi:MAG: hypothetical protein ACYC7L_09305 [Nitrospirota bacterium]
MRGKGIAVAVAVTLLLAPALLRAQQKSAIELTSLAEVEVAEKNARGEKVVRRKEAALAKVVPGDVVIFTTAYRNTGKQPATSVVITNPVPGPMAYIDKSAEGKGARIDYSVDHGRSFGLPATLTVTDSQGRVRPAVASDYTVIRWVLTAPLAPGGTGTVSFRARVK